ncbi:prepilin peptidase [Oribacterium sp. WCC10]|uniref:prepilin peptidase n=1 Tax=Oribacterium sp. WCC10 TaxID=1855343 RepID=UPI0008DF58F0|nr:prepilin peptidase [Oribacterium sp. WCC10]SFG34095.1 Type IV leader peptidase family protein [Oribacterium sp. WCC10]
MIVSSLVLLQCLYGAALTDFYGRRIPNIYIGFYIILGMFLNFGSINYLEQYGHISFLSSIIFFFTFLITVLILSVLTAMTNAGAGDAKLLALITSWSGFCNGIIVLFPGLLLALALIMVSKAETVFSHNDSANSHITSPLYDYGSPPIGSSLPLAVPVFLGAIPGLITYAFS